MNGRAQRSRRPDPRGAAALTKARPLWRRTLPRLFAYKLSRRGWPVQPRPLTLTFSVTGACQSNCRTCRIGERYRQDPAAVRRRELRLDEIEKIFAGMGPVIFFNLSGGEPFLREDLPAIVDLALDHLRPSLIHIPTNAFLPEQVERLTRQICLAISRRPAKPTLTIKPSVDGIGERHDDVRGLPGNFARLEDCLARLKRLAGEFPFMVVELGTVISKYNADEAEAIAAWAERQEVGGYRHEIAESRDEFFNLGEAITPDAATYARLLAGRRPGAVACPAGRPKLPRLLEALRQTYYDLALRVLRENRQVLPCYAGISNIHLNYDGEAWPCCVLGSRLSLGQFRDCGYRFAALRAGQPYSRALRSIRAGKCHCPLANQGYSNIILDGRSLWRCLGHYLRLRRPGPRAAGQP